MYNSAILVIKMDDSNSISAMNVQLGHCGYLIGILKYELLLMLLPLNII